MSTASERKAMILQFGPQPETHFTHQKRQKGFELLGRHDFRGKTVLDLGAFAGFVGMQCRLLGASRVVLIDLFKEAFHPSFERVVGDKTYLPFKDEYFDFVVTRDVLHHGLLNECVKEVHRVLVPNGIFISVEEPCISSKDDEQKVLIRDCKVELDLGIDERRPNILQYQSALSIFREYKILSGFDLKPAVDRDYGGSGVVVEATK